MPVRYLSSSTHAPSSPRFDTESGSQTTEYALIMVVTGTRLSADVWKFVGGQELPGGKCSCQALGSAR